MARAARWLWMGTPLVAALFVATVGWQLAGRDPSGQASRDWLTGSGVGLGIIDGLWVATHMVRGVTAYTATMAGAALSALVAAAQSFLFELLPSAGRNGWPAAPLLFRAGALITALTAGGTFGWALWWIRYRNGPEQ